MPGCSVSGPSRQAVAEAIDAEIAAYFEAAATKGVTVQPPGTDAKFQESMRSELVTLRNNIDLLEARLEQILAVSH